MNAHPGRQLRTKGIAEEDYLGLIEPIAPAFAGLPGLVSKTWLANKETDIYKGMQANPHFENVADFAVAENATRVTRGYVEVVA